MIDQTRNCIREGMITLLKEKDYNKIQMKEIAERAHVGRRTLYRYFESKEQILEYVAVSQMGYLTDEILLREPLTLSNVLNAFFVFIEKHRTEFEILKKARLLSYMEDHLFELVTGVAAKTKYRDMAPGELDMHLNTLGSEDYYSLHYTIAGAWRVAMLWMDKTPRHTPEEMADLTMRIILRGSTAS